MKAPLRTFSAFIPGIPIACIGGFGYWLYKQTAELPFDFRGSLLSRARETIQAAFPFSSHEHVKMVASLSAKAATNDTLSAKETDSILTSYYAGYLWKVLNENPAVTPPVFRYDENLRVLLPLVPGQQSHQGFVFAGRLPYVHEAKARSSILQRDYVTCRKQLHSLVTNNCGTQNELLDVLLVGTKEHKKCSHFERDMIRDVAYLAAGGDPRRKLRAEEPYSDTVVLSVTEKGTLQEEGDLGSLSETLRKGILYGNFTVCPSYTHKKTRLSRGNYKDTHAIVVGVEDDEVCGRGQLQNLVNLLNRK
jgi:hypothetical protein